MASWNAWVISTLSKIGFPNDIHERTLHAAQLKYTGDSNFQDEMIRFNRTTKAFEEYDSGTASWVEVTHNTQRRVLTSDVAMTGSNVYPASLNDMTSSANTRYIIKGFFDVVDSGAGGRLFAANIAATNDDLGESRRLFGITREEAAGSTHYDGNVQVSSSVYFSNNLQFYTSTFRMLMEFNGVSLSDGTSGTFDVYFNGADSDIVIKAGSWVEVTKIANP